MLTRVIEEIISLCIQISNPDVVRLNRIHQLYLDLKKTNEDDVANYGR